MKVLHLNRFRESESGAVAVEFAIVGLLFLSIVLAIFEFSRIMWVKQAVSDIAFRTARCATIGGTGNNGVTACTDNGLVTDFVIDEANSIGIFLDRANITVQQSVMCNGYLANQVLIVSDYNSPASGLITALKDKTLTVEACFPA